MKETILTMSLAACAVFASASITVDTERALLPGNISQRLIPNTPALCGQPSSLADILAHQGITPAKVSQQSDELIYEAPEGEKGGYSAGGFSFSLTWTGVSFSYMSGVEKEIVRTDDALYIKNPFISFMTNTYMKADYKDGKYVTSLPLLIYQEQGFDGSTVSYYANILKKEVGDGGVSYVQGDDTEISFVLEENGNVVLDLGYDPVPDENGFVDVPDKILALTDADGNWFGVGDGGQVYTPFTDETMTPPADLKTDDWAFLYDGIGRFIEIGFEGDNVWFKGIFTTLPDAWVKGVVKGDEIEIPSLQYLGKANGYFTYLLTLEIDDDGYVTTYPSLMMNYDAENKVIETKSPNDVLLLNAGKETIAYLTYVKAPRFKLQPEDINGQVQNPRDLVFNDYFSSFGMAFFDFTLPILNVDGDILNTDNMYYNVLFDGEVWTFYSDEYPEDVEDEITDIPFNFGVRNFWGDSTGKKEIVIFTQGLSSIGVQLFNKVNGKVYSSDVVSIGLMNGVSEVSGQGEVVSEEWYDLSGVRVERPGKGLFIKKSVLSDGSVRTSKAIR